MMPGTDRALQDALIRLLADAPFRTAIEAATDGNAHGEAYVALPREHVAILRSIDPARVRRFAHFLARQFYFERLAHFHRYSHALARWTHRSPEAVLRSPEFDALLPSLVLGSRQAACDVANLLSAYLAGSPAAPPYMADVIRYENAQFITESGPRTWRSDEPAPPLTLDDAPIFDPGAMILAFEWDLPRLFPALLAESADAPPDGTRAPLTLLFARSPRGRVSVLRLTPPVVALLRRLDGAHSLAAASDGLPPAEAAEIANLLLDAGALARALAES